MWSLFCRQFGALLKDMPLFRYNVQTLGFDYVPKLLMMTAKLSSCFTELTHLTFLLTELELRGTDMQHKVWAPGKPFTFEAHWCNAVQCLTYFLYFLYHLIITLKKGLFPFSLNIIYSCLACRTYFASPEAGNSHKCFSFPSSTCAKEQGKKKKKQKQKKSFFFKNFTFILLAWTQAGSRKLLPHEISDKLALRAWHSGKTRLFISLDWGGNWSCVSCLLGYWSPACCLWKAADVHFLHRWPQWEVSSSTARIAGFPWKQLWLVACWLACLERGKEGRLICLLLCLSVSLS